MVQRLEERSLVHILARLGLTRKTGRLILMESGSGLDVARREIDLLQGAPTFVYTDRPELQLPELLARRELVGDEPSCNPNARSSTSSPNERRKTSGDSSPF